ncbi:MAG: OmpA family protein [Prolixibacteraceae bacterium]|jgi:chemotaxis protein MotB|nr:OmpA family protein [Prolixibacteraceae bacterium]MDD4755810.1 OmpA family protein [Prolixibacteraceae bacterium]NLO03516.1 OmpA family protein [Bacteroidales bacterium]
MRTVVILSFLIIMFSSESCVSLKKFNDTSEKLNRVIRENQDLKQANSRFEINNTELEDMNKRLAEKNRELTGQVEESLYNLNLQKQKNDVLSVQQERLTRELDLLKTGSTSEIEMLLEELQIARNDLNMREDRLREAEKELTERNSRLIELQNILAQKDQAVQDLKNRVINALTGFNNNGLTVHEKNGKVYVSMEEKLLFKTGRWDVDPNGIKALNEISSLLAENPDINITVEGHTDDVPMRGSGDVKDNWDLSVMRATAVTKILTANKQIDPNRIIASGRSEFVPLTTDKTADARQMNRRTEIILTPKLDELLKIIEMN